MTVTAMYDLWLNCLWPAELVTVPAQPQILEAECLPLSGPVEAAGQRGGGPGRQRESGGHPGCSDSGRTPAGPSLGPETFLIPGKHSINNGNSFSSKYTQAKS